MDSRHILLVDDTKALADLYAAALGHEGYQVTSVHSGSALLQILENDAFAPDLLVLDVKLPDMDGLEILARLKEVGFDALSVSPLIWVAAAFCIVAIFGMLPFFFWNLKEDLCDRKWARSVFFV